MPNVLLKRWNGTTWVDLLPTPGSHTQTISTISDSTDVGQNLVKLTNPSAIRFLRVNADNSVSTLSDSDFRTAISVPADNTVVKLTGDQSVSGVKTFNNNIALAGGDRTITNTANNSLAFGTNNATRITILNDGNVGIGITNPTEKLDVDGKVKATSFTSTVNVGTAPLTVNSTTVVTNLNADLLDGQDGLYYASKEYVDNVAQGLKAAPAVEVATTANLTATYNNGTSGVNSTLTSTTNGAFPEIDGYTLTSTVIGSNGVLVKNQTNAAHNGRYNLTQQGTASLPWILTRCAVCDESDEISGSYVFVKHGDTLVNTGWIANVTDAATFIVGTDPINYFQFSGVGTYTAGDGLDLNGPEFSVDTDRVVTKDVNGNITATTATISAAQGTSPFNITSTTAVTNLNADLLDGNHASAFALDNEVVKLTGNQTVAGNKTFSDITTFGNIKANGSSLINVSESANSVYIGDDFLELNTGLGYVILNDGMQYIKNNTGSGTALYINQANATATGNLLDLSFNSTIKTSVDKDGTVTASNYVSNITTGTQPYATTSTTVNTNLNADLLDGNHASAFALDNAVVKLTGDQTIAGTKTFSSVISGSVNGNAQYLANNNANPADANSIWRAGIYTWFNGTNVPTGDFGLISIPTWGSTSSTNRYNLQIGANIGGSLRYRTTDVNGAGTFRTVWDNNNDGAGSGLDADLLDGMNTSTANTVSTVVARDASGNFSAGTITASLTGTASGNIVKTGSRTAGNIPTWSNADGGSLGNGYTVETTLSGASTAIPRADAVKTYVDGLLSASDAMIFKGTVGTGGTYTIANFNALATYQAGWTYRIIEAGTIKGKVSEIGDLVIATVDRAGSSNVDADWTTVQTNIDGAVTGPTSSISGNIATFNGTGGKIIQDGGASLETTLTTNSDAKIPTSKAVATYITGFGYTTNTGTVTGVTATAPIASTGGTAPVISHNNSGVTAGTYNNVTVNVTGHVTSGSNVSYLTAHPTIPTTTDTTSTASPAFGGTFTTIDGVTRDANGHVTTLNTKTVTIPTPSYPTVNNATLTLAASTGISLSTTPTFTANASVDKTITITNSAPHIGTNLTWTAGTTAGPVVNSSTGTGQAIPSASISASGAVTTGAQEFAGNKTFRVATTQDGIVLAGRAGGTGSFGVTLTPTTLNANRTLTLPDATGTVALTSNIPTVNNGTLSWATNTAGSTNTTIAPSLSGAYSANTADNRTLSLAVGPSLTNLATTMTGATPVGFLKKTGQDTYSIDTNTYLTSFTETDTLATVTGRGATTATAISLTNATTSTSTTTGALVVTGGVGIGENLNIAGNITFTNSASRNLSIASSPSGTVGRDLYISAGSTTAGTANRSGGSLFLQSGNSTGSGSNIIRLSVPSAGVVGDTQLTSGRNQLTLSQTGLEIFTTLPSGLDGTTYNFGHSGFNLLSYESQTGDHNQFRIDNYVNSSTNSITKTSLYIESSGTWDGVGAVNRGLYVNAVDGTINYAAIFDGGNVGIGTTSPTEKLEVNGNIKSSQLITDTISSGSTDIINIQAGEFITISAAGGSANEGFISLSAANGSSLGALNTFSISSFGAEVLTYLPDNNDGTSYTLGTNGFNSISYIPQTENHIQFAINDYTNSSTNSITKTALYIDSSGTWNGTGAVNRGLYVTATGGTNNYSAIFDQGNVGVGTTTPTAKLDVDGDLKHTGLTMTTGTNVDQTKSTTLTSALTTSWTDVTGVSGTYLATGSYIVQIISNGEYYTGNMTWFSGATTTNTADEITLHRAGPSGSSARIYARVVRGSANELKLQVSASASVSSHTLTFNFRRTI